MLTDVYMYKIEHANKPLDSKHLQNQSSGQLCKGHCQVDNPNHQIFPVRNVTMIHAEGLFCGDDDGFLQPQRSVHFLPSLLDYTLGDLEPIPMLNLWLQLNINGNTGYTMLKSNTRNSI